MLTKEECDKALTRLLRPYFAKVGVQNVYHDINRGHSIDEDSNLLTLLIMEHSNLLKKYDLALKKLEQSEWEYQDKLMTKEKWNELFEEKVNVG